MPVKKLASSDFWTGKVRLWILLIAGAVAAMTVLPQQIYNLWPGTQVERHISEKQRDIRDAMDYHTALLMSEKTEAEIDRANKFYETLKKGRGVK